MYEIKNEDVYEDFSNDKEMFAFNKYPAKSEYYHDSNTLAVGILQEERSGVATEEFVGLKPTNYLHGG